MFTDENAACMVIGEENYAMLLTENFIQDFSNGSDGKKVWARRTA